ncbi:tyrosine-type recombinase/integrase [Microcoleus sp. S13_C5]|uniref:tyrosine-type recombinase/integrase n=1 Tax=Microcoleus sp. S13_C5 TaxID=3055411 RepID=UPI002FCF7F5B
MAISIRNQQLVKICGVGQATPLNPVTFQQISNHLTSDCHKLFLAVAWYTGERPEAILSMDVKHVYEDVQKRKPRDTVLYPLFNRKDKQTREVPSNWALKLMLGAYEAPESGFLFPSLYRTDKHLSRQAIDKAFRRALKKAGLQNKGFSLYSARRGFITRLNEQGLDIKVIQRLTGHKSINSLIRYIDVTDDQLKNAIANF